MSVPSCFGMDKQGEAGAVPTLWFERYPQMVTNDGDVPNTETFLL
jgi:hypothetical protein